MIGRGRDLSERREELTLDVKVAEPQRLDQYVLGSLNWKSRNRIQTLIHDGCILVNGERSKPSRKVRYGDEVVVQLSMGTGLPEDYDARNLERIYEDGWILVLDKPPGLLVHPVGRHVYDTLINYLHHQYRDIRGEDGLPVRPHLCHRLDRDTTGILVLGKDRFSHRDVQMQFESRAVSKEYIALVVGTYPRDADSVEVPIGEGRSLESCLEHPVLKESRTSLRVLRRFQGHTLLSCVPHTGRQNQIRVHLASVGFPIAGDVQYGGGPPPEGFPPRYLLHSRAIRFYHPRLKSWLELKAPLPADFRHLLERLA